MQEIIINNISYYYIDDVRSNYPSIFPDKKIPTRKMIVSSGLSSDDYIFAYLKKDQWIISTSAYCKAKLFISKKYIESMIIKNEDNDIMINLPNMIINGNELNIEVKAIKSVSIDNILIRVKDVAREFETQRLKDVILRKETSYEANVDYKYVNMGGASPYLYLTYYGFLRFIFISRGSKIAADVQRWATDIIYKCQFGNDDEKMTLVKTIVPDYSNIVCDIFGKFEFPCIYLLGIGTYKEHENVYKFGRTDNFQRRYKEHNKTYNTICSVCVLQYIDTDYLAKAETEIKNYMLTIHVIIQDSSHDELVSLTDKQLKSVVNMYKYVSHTYSTKTDLLQKQIDDLQHQVELLEKDNEIRLLKASHENEILKKDIQYLTLENNMLKMKI